MGSAASVAANAVGDNASHQALEELPFGNHCFSYKFVPGDPIVNVYICATHFEYPCEEMKSKLLSYADELLDAML